ncbi:MAG TPA: hypothetical protein VFE78_39170 [Gemmataceae bacterium]|jgi:hypothetical protein|nr:hypothetical protein [Gemmataceae bacterium]
MIEGMKTGDTGAEKQVGWTMSNDNPDVRLNALLQRLQGLELHVAQIREVLKQQARLCLALSRSRPELAPQIGDVLQQMAWKGESVAALTPGILESAKSQFSEEEIVAGLREVRATGGLELDDFLHELEEAAGPDE